MTNLRNLKDQNKFKRISVTDHYTLPERQIIKEYTQTGQRNITTIPRFKIHLAFQGNSTKGVGIEDVLETATVHTGLAGVTHNEDMKFVGIATQ